MCEEQRNHLQEALLLNYERALAVFEHQIDYDRASKTIYLSQQHYIESILEEFTDFVSLNTSVITPTLENLKLLATDVDILNATQLQSVLGESQIQFATLRFE